MLVRVREVCQCCEDGSRLLECTNAAEPASGVLFAAVSVRDRDKISFATDGIDAGAQVPARVSRVPTALVELFRTRSSRGVGGAAA